VVGFIRDIPARIDGRGSPGIGSSATAVKYGAVRNRSNSRRSRSWRRWSAAHLRLPHPGLVDELDRRQRFRVARDLEHRLLDVRDRDQLHRVRGQHVVLDDRAARDVAQLAQDRLPHVVDEVLRDQPALLGQ
jgi:hypothetical protein